MEWRIPKPSNSKSEYFRLKGNMAARSNHQNRDEKMRVLRIAHSSLTPALRHRERALARCYPNVDLEVITTDRWCEAEVMVDAAPDDLFHVRTARPYLSKHIQLFAYDPRPIVKALQRHRPHLIDLGHEWYSVACAEVLTLCSWFAPHVPIVMQANQNIHHNYPPPFNWLERRAFRQVAAAYACSESVCEVLRAKGFSKPAPIIPFGVNTETFRPRPASSKQSNRPLTIGFVGRLLPGKGLNVLAAALEKLKLESWRLLVVGDGPEREGFEQRLSIAGLRDRAVFTGAIDFDLVPEQFQQIDVLVLPTETTKRVREQFGRVLVEAMASGVSVVGSTCGAIPEVIRDAGLIFREGDADALAGALQRMLSDESLRESLVASGLEQVKRYSWERVAEKTYELFRQVLRNSEATALNRTLAPARLIALGCLMMSVLDLVV
jgi:glycosyltransferase involved in cell wall biosynthesis